MAKRSLKTEQELEIQEEEDDPESEIEEETESDDDDDDDDEGEERVVERGKRIMIRVVPVKRSVSQSGLVSCCSSSSSGGYLGCQADECGMDLSNAKIYHRRHKVCERHAKAAVVLFKGIRQRFCQQCSRFHEISEFDDSKRSCRSRLAGHNERRRKIQADLQPEDGQEPPMSKLNGSSLKAIKLQNHGEMTYPGSPNTKHFRIR